jgi:hypothetical protein
MAAIAKRPWRAWPSAQSSGGVRNADHSAGAYSAYANPGRIDAEIAKDQPIITAKRIISTGRIGTCHVGTGSIISRDSAN